MSGLWRAHRKGKAETGAGTADISGATHTAAAPEAEEEGILALGSQPDAGGR